MTMWFGSPWDAPVLDDPEAVHVPEVPTYARCLRCHEVFEAADQGFIQPYIGGRVDPDFLVGVGGRTDLVALHRECELASLVGHVVGVCSCTGWDPFDRETGREVQRRIDAGALR